jgi:hypothetical protein
MKASTTDLLTAWGTVSGAAFAAVAAIVAFLVLIHEIKMRKRDENDMQASTARSVIVTLGEVKGERPRIGKEGKDGSIESVEFLINNFSRFPVIDVLAAAGRRDGKGDYVLNTDALKPGESKLFEWSFDPPLTWPRLASPQSMFNVDVIFTDDAGLRWRRINRQQPRRVFLSDQLPSWADLVEEITKLASAKSQDSDIRRSEAD